MKKIGLLPVPLLLVGVAVIAACGGDNAKSAPPASNQGGGAPASSGLSLSLRDNFFAPTTLSVRAVQTVLVNIKNEGSSGHTFTIDGLAETGMVAAGAATTSQFNAPAAGTMLQFYCMIHGKAVMSGLLAVTP